MEDKKIDVTALGELLIDFTQNGISSQGNFLFEANPGGAPCNVLAMLTKLGNKTAFLGKVGDDFFGRHLKEVIEEAGIIAEDLIFDHTFPTTLAFVHTKADGDRDFSFYRNPGADMNIREEEIRRDTISASKIFHIGSLSMTHETNRAATKKALRIAKENQCRISFDPNLRKSLWKNSAEAREQIAYGMSVCDILKISDNEIEWFTDIRDYDKAVHKIREEYNIPFVVLSLGNRGSRAYSGGNTVMADAFIQSSTIETTGAGDTFCACVLHHLLQYGLHNLDELSKTQMKEMLIFANAAASIVTTRKGALKVMPSGEEIEKLINCRKE